MPTMRPPHYQGLVYNGRHIADGDTVDVLPRDVVDFEAADWHRVDPVGDQKEPQDLAELEAKYEASIIADAKTDTEERQP